MDDTIKLQHLSTIPLAIAPSCALLGITPNGNIITECYFDDTDDVAQYHIPINTNNADNITPMLNPIMDKPLDLKSPNWVTDHPLNKTGLRLRGLRETDRLDGWVEPIPIMEKMPLVPKLGLNITPMQLLGIAESTVLSTCHLNDNISLVCRRVRLAYALPTPINDENGIPYDYDTHTLYLAHPYNNETDTAPPLQQCLQPIDSIHLHTPQDCLRHEDKLIILDCGNEETTVRLIIWQINPQD